MTPSFTFTPGDVVLVTGAGSGIGRATALHAAEVGLTVAAWDINAAGVADTVAEVERLGGTALAVTADVSVPEQIERGLAASRELGTIRHLVNNAGPSSAVDLDFDEAMLLSVGSMRRMVDAWLAPAPAGATLVNIASVAGNVIGTASDWYCAGKAAITGYTRHLAAYRSDEVRANAVAPGMTDTPRLTGFAASPVGQRALERIPLHRMATPDDIAWAVLFLLSPLASYINGVFLPVDGGWTVTQ
ncbi:SDR family oxidoreductase [Actinokineospora sp. NBRC 105648]|uniref:SDR family NAD(P)-dependent oxidoreductase n=1 Tax=Actinokineospora sp. NBRC 105648 TaxID=3032206 RepID=UPI0025535AB4|nr:SDR family oxidoreductase [Actinokineospora sp. NBRC 105648]